MNLTQVKKYFVLLLLALGSFSYSFGQIGIVPTMEKKVDQKKMTAWVDSVFNSLTPDQRIGQLITAITTGENTDANKKKLLGYVNDQYIGGIIFLKGTPLNQAELTNLCQSAAKTPLLISIDGEWGLSMRLDNTTRFPKNMMLGAVQDDSLLYYYGKEMARQCKIMGIQINYAPDVDVNSNSVNPVIGLRSYGEEPKIVTRLSRMYAKGLEDGGVLSVAKHFPGHGDTSTDSHYTLPLVEHNRDRLEDVELYPFREYIKSGFGGVMIGHLNVPALDASGEPSSLSKAIVTDLLKDKMGFTGLIFSDGLAMKGISDEVDMSIRLLKAGNDVLLGPISPEKEFAAIKKAIADTILTEDLINEKCRKILKWKYILGLQIKPQIATKNLLDALNTPNAEWITRKLNEKGITLLKNEKNILPLEALDKKNIAVISLGNPKGNKFQRTVRQYANTTDFSASSDKDLGALKTQLADFNVVIISIHDNKAYSEDSLRALCDGKKSILVFFVTPYQMKNFTATIKDADGVYVAYEDTQFSNDYAGQAIFGGNAVNGKLPVSVDGLYKEGTGLKTVKERLSYSIPEEVGIPSSKLARIESVIKEGITQKAYPGCQVLIAKDGVVFYNSSFGTFSYSSKQAVTNDNLYDLASMTKAVATVPAVMKLFDEGKIGQNDKLSKYVAVLKGTDKENITLRQALFHETGLPAFLPYYMAAIDENSYDGKLFSTKQTSLYSVEFDKNTWARTDFKFNPNLISTTPKKGFGLQIADKLYASDSYKDTILQSIADVKLRPSAGYLYSCLNFMLIKEAVENISKMDINSFLQQNFYQRLGAYTTTYKPLDKFVKDNIVPTEKDDFLRKQLLQGYVHDEGAAFQGGISGNAGLFSNANDIAKLCQMFLNQGEYGGERYLSKQTCRAFTITKSGMSRRGLGFDKPDVRNSNANPCSPSTPLATYGHTGFTGTCFWVDPDNQLIYIFLSNRVNEKRSNRKLMSLNIRTRIQEEIYNAMK
ncbi:MAG: glycoside hydrolase family 3 N-terminal domain-containing protein [Dysgonomonas sp.]